MTVSKKSTSWLCTIGVVTLLASPVAAEAQPAAGASQAAGAERRATGAPQSAGAQPTAGAPRAAGVQRAAGAPQEAGAQRRAAGARARGAVRRARPVLQTRAWYGPGYGYYSPVYHPTYFYAPQWGPYSFGPWGPYPFYGGYYYRERGSVRLQVKPVETEVYVDGYYAGVVDSYDGFFQRLSLPPGQHDIELRLEGYRSIQEQVYLTIGQSYRIQHEMERLGPGETTPPPPTPPAEPEVEPAPVAAPFARPDTDRLPPWHETSVTGFGRIVVRVQPTDAAIFVDGEEWQSPNGSRLELELGVGRHRIEVWREGHEGYVTDVTVRSGETTAVNISLPRNRPELPEEAGQRPGA